MKEIQKIPKINPKRPGFIPAPNFSTENQPEGRGRPKGSVSIINHLKRLLKENNELEAKRCGVSLIKNFRKGYPAVVKEVLGRIDGVLVEKHEIDLAGDISAHVAAVMQEQANKTEESP